MKNQKITIVAAIISVFGLLSGGALAFEGTSSLSSFESVYIAPVSIDLPESTNRRDEDRPVSRRDQDAKAEDLFEDLTAAFEGEFSVVSAPGDGVLTIETTITDLRSSRPTQADLSREPGLSFSSVYAGGVAATFSIYENSTLLAETEENYYSNFNDGQPRVGVWQDADRGFSRISRRIVKYIQKN